MVADVGLRMDLLNPKPIDNLPVIGYNLLTSSNLHLIRSYNCPMLPTKT